MKRLDLFASSYTGSELIELIETPVVSIVKAQDAFSAGENQQEAFG